MVGTHTHILTNDARQFKVNGLSDRRICVEIMTQVIGMNKEFFGIYFKKDSVKHFIE